MENPFESGDIKNYLLLYGAVVVIMVLFFIAASLFHESEDVNLKVFETIEPLENAQKPKELKRAQENHFKLLERGY